LSVMCFVVVFKCRPGAGRSPYVAAHRRGTGLGLAARPCPRPRARRAEGRRAGGRAGWAGFRRAATAAAR
jgi:hypothetical protein